MEVRYYLDEHVPRSVAAGLRSRGVDVVRVVDAGLRTASDHEHLEWARREHRVIVTSDADFLRIHADGADHSGIAFVSSPRRIGDLIRGLLLLRAAVTAEEMRRRVEFL